MSGKRTDGNSTEIVNTLLKVGAGWIPTSGDPKIGFDGVILFRGRAHIAEIKDGSLPPSRRKLTDNELKRQRQCKAANVPYLILLSSEDALKAIGL